MSAPAQSQSQATDFVIVGKMNSPFGVQGWIKVQSFTDPLDNLLNYPEIYYGQEGSWQALKVQSMRQHGQGFVMQVAACEDRDQAALFNGQLLAVKRGELPNLDSDEDGYYWSDLIGCEVITENKAILGTVDSLIDTGANDVLVIKGKREHLVPFIQEHFIKQIDIANKKIIVDWDPEF